MMNFHSVAEFEPPAKQRTDDDLWDFISNGAADGTTLLRNREAFDGITINPRFLVDVSCRDTSTTVLGETISFPVITAPAAPFRHAHPEGELAVARAVMIGRPVFWGLAVGGEEGVYRVLEILREEFDHAMAFCGITNVEGIDRRVLSWK